MLQVVLIAALVIILFPWVRRRLGRFLWYLVAALVVFLLIVMLTQERSSAAADADDTSTARLAADGVRTWGGIPVRIGKRA